jgi:hypothetical protein
MNIFKRKKKDINFPFNEPLNLGVFSCKHVIDNAAPILLVHHSVDGDWEFWCDKEHTMDSVLVVALYGVYAIDPTIGVLSQLPLGYVAERETINSDWKVYKMVVPVGRFVD